jgi:hypothetical protein
MLERAATAWIWYPRKKGSFFGGEGSAGLDHHEEGGRDRPKVILDGAVPGDGAGEVGQVRVRRKINGEVDGKEDRGPDRQGDCRPKDGAGGLAGRLRVSLSPGELFGFLMRKDHEGGSGGLSGGKCHAAGISGGFPRVIPTSPEN